MFRGKGEYAAAIKRLSIAVTMFVISPVIDTENQGTAEARTRPLPHSMSCYLPHLATGVKCPAAWQTTGSVSQLYTMFR